MTWQDALLTSLAPYFPVIIDTLVTGLVGWAAMRFARWSGIQIDKKMQDDLHRAASTAAMTALARGLRGTAAETMMQGYIEESVPDALKRLAPSPAVLQAIMRAKMAELLPPVPEERI
jgi:hypothetical protein